MKKTLLILAAVAFSFGTSFAQSVEKTITSNLSQDIVPGSVACGAEGVTSENHYYKKFNLADLGVEDTFHIQSFEFGVENIQTVVDPEVFLVVELWKTSLNNFPATFPGPDYTELITKSVTVTEADAETVVSVEFDDALTVEADEIIIAHVYHGDLDMQSFYIGSNDAGDDQPSYLMAPGCDIDTPTPVSDLGFNDMFIVMNLKGVEGILGVQDFVNADLTLYPNPASDQFNISSGNEVIQTVIVRDILGKTIETIEVNGLNQDINVSNLPKGLYLVEVELETGRAVQKLIKK